MIVSNPNKDTDAQKQNAVSAGGLTIESTSTVVDNLKFKESLEGTVGSNIYQPDTINSKTDQAEANDVLVGGQKDDAMRNAQFQGKSQKPEESY